MDKIELRRNAFDLASQKFVGDDTNFSSASSIYMASTSNVRDTMALYKDAKKVLALGSTGAHGFEALLNGALKVDMFDINGLQKVFYDLMKKGIMYLEYDEFMKYFSLEKQKVQFTKADISNLLSNEMYDKLVNYLDEETEYVLSPLYDYFYSPDLILSKLFRFEHLFQSDYLKKYVSLYRKDEFYRLKRMLLDGADITYQNISLTDLDKKIDDKYDAIILDNVLQYYYDIPSLNSPSAVNEFIDKRLSNLLIDDGVIQAGYGYEVGTALFKDEFNISYDEKECGFAWNIIKELEKRKCILIPLVKYSKNYSYDFIPGVEMFEGHNSQNMVVTYRKK